MKNFKLIKYDSIVNCTISLILGLLLLLFPIESLNIAGYLIASILMLSGISYIIKIINNKKIETNGELLYLILSIGFIIISITIFLDPTWLIRLINILVGIILIITSIINLLNLFKYKNKTTSWYIYTSLIVLIFIIGILVIVNPLFLAKIITRLEGCSLIINTLITILLNNKNKKNLPLLKENNLVF